MKTIRRNFLFVTMIGIIFSISSVMAQKQQQTRLTNDEVLKVQVVDGILVFNNDDEADAIDKQLNKLTEQERYDWENKMGYRSMFGLLYESNLADEAYIDQFFNQGLTEDEILSLYNQGKIEKYSDYTLELIKKGILKEVTFSDGSTGLDVAIVPPISLRFVNADGLVAINQCIYQYKDGITKILTDLDFSKVEELKWTDYSIAEDGINVFSNTNLKGDEPAPVNTMYKGETKFDDHSDSNCSKPGCVKLSSSIWASKYWYQESSQGLKSQVRVYLNNSGYKYKFITGWVRQSDYRFKVSGTYDYGKTTFGGQDANGNCMFITGVWGTNKSINLSQEGGYVRLITEYMVLLQRGCGAMGYVDEYRIDLNDFRINVTLEQTDNGEDVHPTVLLTFQRMNSWISIDMVPSK